ncbi:MAG: His/Gly/Thr/Pro-type tRNA ligase C-terminal domain-containing protein, partial [Candidatus Omnitrophica bacterium]|nr:His/Gly/Thr/Pro-type tRNA ligase C-terminal domain-containing protein [Candidatus Omnitrophota bacterium]
FPVWLAPVQVKILTVADRFIPFGEKVLSCCRKNKIRAELDGSSESLGKKIRTAENEKVPIITVIGEREQLTETLAVRVHRRGMKGTISVDDFISKIKEVVETKSIEVNF